LDQLRQRSSVLEVELGRAAARLDSVEQRLSGLIERIEMTSAGPAAGGAASSPLAQLQLTVARHRGTGWDQHGRGLHCLANEVGRLAGRTAQLGEPVWLGDIEDAQVLYITGQGSLNVADSDIAAVGRVLERGGAVIGDGCAAGPSGEAGARDFGFSFDDLARKLGRRLSRLERGHALLENYYVFGEAPPGNRANGRVLAAGGMIYSDADYGCAWQGGPAQQPLARAIIRDALEFGVNLVVYRPQR
jgi:hypothetical protein